MIFIHNQDSNIQNTSSSGDIIILVTIFYMAIHYLNKMIKFALKLHLRLSTNCQKDGMDPFGLFVPLTSVSVSVPVQCMQ